MQLILPYPPSNNRYYRHAKGRTYLSDEGSEYRLAVFSARPRSGWPMEGRLAVTIEVFPQRAASQDVDNIPKAILDSLQHAKIYRNDSQIDELHVIRRRKVKSAHVVVNVEAL